jgi:hypothetical protein
MSLKTSCSTIITPRHRWEDRIKIVFKEIAWDRGGEWINMAQERNKWHVLTTVISILVSEKKCGEFLD